MIVACPYCQVRLRQQQRTTGLHLLIRCPRCREKFKVSLGGAVINILLAHEDNEICRQLSERVSCLDTSFTVCTSEEGICRALRPGVKSILFLDVAFNGSFPFKLIERINRAGNDQHKVVLLPSVYNRAAYKKRPDSLYGADAYLELHHIGDRLLPLLAELFPQLSERVGQVASVSHAEVRERLLLTAELSDQAAKLAQLLVADIVLYHRERLEHGLATDQLNDLFVEQLAEGRCMLLARLPTAAELPVDYIQQAFDAICQSYPRG